MILHNLPYLKELRRQLRQRATEEEKILWNLLRNHKFQDLKFRRQHSFAHFIFDFYCPKLQLVIELDGGYHQSAEQIRADQERDEIITYFGFKVLRIPNERVRNDIENVLKEIASFNYCSENK